MACFILVPLIYYSYVGFFLKSKLSRLQNEYEQSSKSAGIKTEVKYGRFEESARYKKIIEELGEIESKVKANLPSLKNFGGLADKIQSMASECDIEIVNLNIFNPSADSPMEIYPMKIKLECRSTYKSLKKFLWCIENCTNIMFIEKLKIVSKMSEEKLSYSYDLVSYIQK